MRVLNTEIDAYFSVRLARDDDVRAAYDSVGTYAVANTAQRVLRERIGVGKRKVQLGARDGFAGDGAEPFARSEFGGQHFRESSGKPRRIRPAGYVFYGEDGHGTARINVAAGMRQPCVDRNVR